MTRYARQIMVPGVGAEGQARLTAAHVLVVGAGGLGCPALQYLAGAGVGRITVIDPDHVEESNLHRQPLYQMSDLGRAKALAARDHLGAAHPDVDVVAEVGALHPAITRAAVAPADVVIDAADNHAVSYILSDACRVLDKPLISASVLGRTGYVGGYCGGAPSLRAVFPDPPASGATCASAGVMGPVVGMIGAMQAQFTLQVLLAQDPSPLGRVVTADLQEMRFGGFAFHETEEPDGALPFLSLCNITASDMLIDLRGEDEAPDLLTPDAVRWSPDIQASVIAEPGRRVVLCCATGLRAWRAAGQFVDKGCRDVGLVAARACA